MAPVAHSVSRAKSACVQLDGGCVDDGRPRVSQNLLHARLRLFRVSRSEKSLRAFCWDQPGAKDASPNPPQLVLVRVWSPHAAPVMPKRVAHPSVDFSLPCHIAGASDGPRLLGDRNPGSHHAPHRHAFSSSSNPRVKRGQLRHQAQKFPPELLDQRCKQHQCGRKRGEPTDALGQQTNTVGKALPCAHLTKQPVPRRAGGLGRAGVSPFAASPN